MASLVLRYNLAYTYRMEWRPIPSSGGWYEASDTGLIRPIGKPLKPWVTRAGRATVTLWLDGESEKRAQRHYQVHRAVAEAFFGRCPKGLEVNHKDGNPLNNRVENLEYVTKKGNMRHAHQNGLMHPRYGEQHPHAKLTGREARAILAVRGKVSSTELAKRYGLCPSAITRIWTGARWGHLLR